jgi:hypothetical protein
MRAEEARSALIGLLRADGVEDGRCDLPHVWPAVRRWLSERVDGPVGELNFECVALTELPTQAALASAAQPDYHEVFGLELVRELVNQPMVGLGLYFSIDDDWRALGAREDYRHDHQFVWEVYARDNGAPAAFLETIEGSAYFQMAATKTCELTKVTSTFGDSLEFRKLSAHRNG